MVRGASRELLVTTIAWHLQARQHGGLTPAVQRKLERLAAAIDRGEPVRPLTALERLRREQQFYSLDAQREAGKAYVKSQQTRAGGC